MDFSRAENMWPDCRMRNDLLVVITFEAQFDSLSGQAVWSDSHEVQ
jgi:hypothetical protein